MRIGIGLRRERRRESCVCGCEDGGWRREWEEVQVGRHSIEWSDLDSDVCDTRVGVSS